jgi:pimeloyl-ACP methyl ester carboxylesterase
MRGLANRFCCPMLFQAKLQHKYFRMGSWSETWRASMEHVVKLGYRAVAIDMPPFGYSLPPASGDYSKPAQAKRIRAALDSLGIRRATFVAHSFGATPLMEAIFAAPERATSLILVDAGLGLDQPQTDGSDNRLQRMLRQRWLSESISAALLTNPAFTRTMLRSFISEKDKATSDWVDLYQRPLSLKDAFRHIALWLPNLLADRGQANSDNTDAYARLRVPVVLVWGETDTITPLSQAQQLEALIPKAKLIKIKNAGHIPQIEEPEAFQAALTQAFRADSKVGW